jgi:transcriptional regulator with AAA-type ATPase domain
VGLALSTSGRNDPGDVATAPLRKSGGTAAQLKVISNAGVATFPLPDSGTLVIGRAVDCDISVPEESLSRRHARLELGPPMRIVDLGSANGTVIGGQALAANSSREITPSEMIELGSVLVTIVMPPRSVLGGLRRVWAHGDFEAKLDEECARGGHFAVARIRVAAPPEPARLEPVLLGVLRAGDSLARYVPGEYHAVLPGVTPSGATELASGLVTGLTSAGLDARVGLACFPGSGTTAAALVASAGAQLAPAGVPVLVPPPASGAMARVYRLIERVAPGTINVLLLGETGVGKEILAEAIHERSPRRSQPLLRLNCAALTESLLESELFGHEKGAFTGALAAKPGLLESAHGGTVFLDEIGELSPSAQAKLLRVIETRQVTRVGALEARAIDVRFVAATHRDLEAASAQGAFRQDLYFRIGGMAILVPPLRERSDEIEPLARAFITAAARAAGRPVPALSREALDALRAYRWPGNIRELRNVLERAVLLTEGEIGIDELPVEKLDSTLYAPVHDAPASPGSALSSALEPLRAGLAEAERARILAALDECGGNQSRAAKRLGISRGALIARLDSYGVPRPRKKT